MFVTNCTTNRSNMPNPTCCTDPTVMCAKCAAKVLASNQKELVLNDKTLAPDVPLGLPMDSVLNESEAVYYREGVLGLPSIDWSKAVA
jgi:hypothetical protein